MVDLIFDLIVLLFDLTGEVWPVILALLGYLLFGKAARQRNKKAQEWGKWIEEVTDILVLEEEEEPRQARRISRPSAAPDVYGDWPEYKPVEQLEKAAERREAETAGSATVAGHSKDISASPAPMEHTTRPIGAVSTGQSLLSAAAAVSRSQQQLAVDKREGGAGTPFDPREGLKWAIIFSPPRAKAAYRPPSRTGRII